MRPRPRCLSRLLLGSLLAWRLGSKHQGSERQEGGELVSEVWGWAQTWAEHHLVVILLDLTHPSGFLRYFSKQDISPLEKAVASS